MLVGILIVVIILLVLTMLIVREDDGGLGVFMLWLGAFIALMIMFTAPIQSAVIGPVINGIISAIVK